MSREKQIEEMALDVMRVSNLPLEIAGAIAMDLVDLDYRKEIQGEWIFTTETDVDFYTRLNVATCSNCGEKIWYKCKKINLYNYCPNCGAKMKGAE